MRSAGFKLSYSSNSLFIWALGDIRVATGQTLISLRQLIGYVINNAVCQDRKNTVVEHKGFKTTNE
jgi:hypothetical protein